MIFCKYQFNIKFIDDFEIPDFFGSILRSGFGKIFRDSTCVNKKINCNDCHNIKDCAYSYVFETNVIEGNKQFNAPHPFVFEIEDTENKYIKKNSNYNFHLILLGKGIKYFPLFLRTFEKLGKEGIGKNRSKFFIETIIKNNDTIYKDEILYENWNEPEKISLEFDNFNEVIKIDFITPTKIIFNKNLISVPSFEIIISSIIRRLNLLEYYHSIGFEMSNKEEIIDKAKKIEIFKYDLYDVSKKRYSYRKKMDMEFRGFKGSVNYKGNFSPFIEVLKLGEIVHIGKATAFGFGQFKIKGG